jgi:hypothetical protein
MTLLGSVRYIWYNFLTFRKLQYLAILLFWRCQISNFHCTTLNTVCSDPGYQKFQSPGQTVMNSTSLSLCLYIWQEYIILLQIKDFSFTNYNFSDSQVSSVGTMTRLPVGWPRIRGSIPCRRFISPSYHLDQFQGPPSLLLNVYWGLFPQGVGRAAEM